MTFYAVEIAACPSLGWEGGPNANVRITDMRNGHERRNRNASMRHSYTLPFQNIRDDDYLAYIKSAYMALGGPTDSFLVKDFSDFQATAESLGNAPSGTTPVQLTKTYSFGPASHVRKITKPVAGAVIRQAGVTKAGTLDTLTGLFTPSTAWTQGAALTWTGEFRVPCRFAQFFLPASIDNRMGARYATNSAVELIEVFGE